MPDVSKFAYCFVYNMNYVCQKMMTLGKSITIILFIIAFSCKTKSEVIYFKTVGTNNNTEISSEKIISYEPQIIPDDILSIDSLSDFQATNASIVRKIYQLLQSWVNIYIESENRYLQDNERKAMLYLLRNILVIMDRNIKTNRENGREQAKALKHYRGRKPIKVDYHQLKQILYEFENNLISEQEAMHRLSINSRSTFYRKLKLVRNNSL